MDGSHLEIRKATESDLPRVLGLYQQGLNDARVLGLAAAAGILRRMASYPDYGVYVAIAPRDHADHGAGEIAGEIVGTFALLVMDNLAHFGTPSAVVEDVCVDARARGRGIGRAMMAFALEVARARGCYKLSLSSNAAREDAHAFYRSLGFEQHGISFQVRLSPGGATHRDENEVP